MGPQAVLPRLSPCLQLSGAYNSQNSLMSFSPHPQKQSQPQQSQGNPRATMPPSLMPGGQSKQQQVQMVPVSGNRSSNDRSISPGLIPVHQDLIPGSRGESVLANHLYWIQRVAKDECLKLKSLQTAIQLGYCKSIPITDVQGVVTPKDIENEGRPPIFKKGKFKISQSPMPPQTEQIYVVKKKRIINKLSQKINQIASGPAKKDFTKVYETLNMNRPVSDLDLNPMNTKSPIRELLGKSSQSPSHYTLQERLGSYGGIHIPAQGLKEEKTHFLASSQIDLTFPDIKQHVFIESSRNSAGLTDGKTSKYHTINNRGSQNFKPPLPGGAFPTGGPSQRYKNDSKIQNQTPDNPITMLEFKNNAKLRLKYDVQNHISTIFQEPQFDKTKVLKKFDNDALQQSHDTQLARGMLKSQKVSLGATAEIIQPKKAGTTKVEKMSWTQVKLRPNQRSQVLPSINVYDSVSQTGNNDQENMEQGGRSREASPNIYVRGYGDEIFHMLIHYCILLYDNEDLRGDSVLKASVSNLQLPKMGAAISKGSRNNMSVGKSQTLADLGGSKVFTRNNAMDLVKGHSTIALLKENKKVYH